jgi:D-lactate dehydrogenase
MPAVSPLIDSCIECGFCEPQCPSKGLTLTPRQRIAASREMTRLRCDSPQAPEPEQFQAKWIPVRVKKMRKNKNLEHRFDSIKSGNALAAMERDYLYAGDTTCAACSLCSTVCPLEIDTGLYTRRLRARRRGPVGKAVAGAVARNFAVVAATARAGLALGAAAETVLGAALLGKIGAAAHRALGTPHYYSAMPRPAKVESGPERPGDLAPVLFFQSCSSRVMGPAKGDESEPVLTVAKRVFARAGYRLIEPDDSGDLCCGQPFDSKGFADAGRAKAQQLAERLASPAAPVPVVFDASPCAGRMKAFSGPRFQPVDLVQFLHEKVAPRLSLKKTPETVAVHATCTLRQQGLAPALIQLAGLCAEQVISPPGVTCCGFAGDKGFSTPELIDHALRHLAEALPEACHEGYSSNRTCEIGLSSHSGRRYRSILHLVDEASR